MASLVLKSLTCHEQEDFTGDDDIRIFVNSRSVWRGAMDTGQTRNLGNLEVEFSGSAPITLMEVDVEGDDNLGSVTASEGNAGSDRTARFTQDGANYSLIYRVNTSAEDDDSMDEPGEGSPEDTDEADPVDGDAGPDGAGECDDPSEPCPLGTIDVFVHEDDGTAVAGASVNITPAGNSGLTGENGHFDGGSVEEGTYTVTARKDEFVPDPATTEAVVASGATAHADLVLNGGEVVVAIEAGDVACPGHNHEVKASGNPEGGTFEWTVESGSVRLTDVGGAVTNRGDRLFLRGITPEEVRLSVTYTVPAGTATADKTITIHDINYRVRNFVVVRGGFQARESNAAVRMWDIPGSPALSLDPRVRIRLDASCPRKAACAANHRVGWLQVMRIDTREARFPTTRFGVVCPMPIRDAWRDTIPPFYDGPSVRTFTGDGNQQTAHHQDSPVYPGPPGAPWVDPRAGAGNLQSITLADRFTAWLVVQNIEWTSVSVSESFTYLKHLDWRCALTSNIDTARAVGSRASPRRQSTAFASGEGRGAGTPIFTAPTFNTRNNVSRNP